MSLKRILTIAFYAITVLISVIGFYIMLFQSDSLGQPAEVMVLDENLQKGTGIVLWLSVALSIIAAGIAFVVLPVTGMLANPKSLKTAGIGVGTLALIFLAGYVTAGNEVTATYISMGIDTPGKSKFIGGMINATVILFVISILMYVYNTVTDFIKQL
ncbi:MAG: hypothetical protein F9K23_14525 [Bacteroidetes bacterium]|nr:MAG: hypothetical protein F9K23_14525 [Bacteroidota bacterium]